MTKDKATELIKNLLRSAENSIPKMDEITEEAKQGYMRQAEAFTAKAKQLMDKFNISKADLLDSGTENSAEFLGLGVVDYTCNKKLHSKNRQHWFTLLCDAVGKICGVNVQLIGFDTSCRIFGHDQDMAEAAKEMLDGLLAMAHRFYTKLNKTEKDLKRVDYLIGFAVAVRDEAYKPSEENQQGLMRLSNSLTRRVKSLILSQAGQNKELGNAKVEKETIDSKSWEAGKWDAEHRKNVRV